MTWILAVVGAIIASELIIRLPILSQVRIVMESASKAAYTIRSPRISDRWKERALPAFAGRMIFGSLAFLGLLTVAVAPIILLGVFVDGEIRAWTEQLLRPAITGVLIVVSVLYILLRKKIAGV